MNNIVFPRVDSDIRQERIMSEWAITNIIRSLTHQYNGTFRISEDGREFCIYGYYCKINDEQLAEKYYLTVDLKEDNGSNWFQVANKLTAIKPTSGIENVDYYSIRIASTKDDDVQAPLLQYLNNDYLPYVISESEPTSDSDRKKIWINPKNNFIQAIYYNKKWNKLGAVYK